MTSRLAVVTALSLALFTVFAGAEEPAATPNNEQRLLTNTRQLIFDGLRSGEGYFSADGRRMIFQSERDAANPFYQIYVMDLETGDVTQVSPGTGKTTCGWLHPDGSKVLFASSHADPQALDKQHEELEKRASGQGSRYSWSFDEHYDIYEAGLGGERLKNLTNTLGYDAEGSWSPDGRLIAFGSNRHAYTGNLLSDEQKILVNDQSYFMDIYVMDADGSNVRRLTTSPGYDGGPFFSAGGRRIVWRRFNPEGTQAEIWTMNVDGSDQRQITHLGAMSWAPYFHPSGDYIVFATNLHGYGNFELYIVDAEGRSQPARVTETEGFDSLPVFSPDGQGLSWTSARTANKKPQIFMAEWNDAEARRLLGLVDRAGATAVQTAAATEPNLGTTTAEITVKDLQHHLGYLASERLAGRLTGSEGERLATAYVAEVFERLGLQPAGDMGGWYQSFEFTGGIALEAGNRLALEGPDGRQAFEVDRDWRPLTFSRTGEIAPAEIVFAGYGIIAPGHEQFPAYHAYADLDVKDKWVLAFRFLPEDISPEHRQYLNDYASLRYKAMVARDQGARGLILVSGPNAPVQDPLVALKFDSALAGSGIAAISISDALAARLLEGSGRDLKSLQSALDKGEQQPGFALPEVRLGADIRLRQERRSGRNVLARLNAGSAPGSSAVAIGAHVDHIGLGTDMDSLASGDEVGRAHLGADDNASGVSALLEIAQYLADLKRQGQLQTNRDVLFAAWSGEEMGLLGSSHFVQQFRTKGDGGQGLDPAVIAYLNMDMVGRLDRHLHLMGAGSSSVWPGEIERRNVPIGLSIQTQNDSYLPTDATAFYLRGIPILSAFTGVHSEYNTPRDTPDLINYQGLERIARFMALMTRSLAQREQSPDYVLTEKPTTGASRANLRAYVGTIPDYAQSDLKGVKINGVAKGGPAEKGGMRAGDLIVELAGRRIENIYDFTHALNALKVGQEAEVVVEREGRPVRLRISPVARE